MYNCQLYTVIVISGGSAWIAIMYTEGDAL